MSICFSYSDFRRVKLCTVLFISQAIGEELQQFDKLLQMSIYKKTDVPVFDRDVRFLATENFYSMMLVPVISGGWGRPRILSMVGAMSASFPSLLSLQG